MLNIPVVIFDDSCGLMFEGLEDTATRALTIGRSGSWRLIARELERISA